MVTVKVIRLPKWKENGRKTNINNNKRDNNKYYFKNKGNEKTDDDKSKQRYSMQKIVWNQNLSKSRN